MSKDTEPTPLGRARSIMAWLKESHPGGDTQTQAHIQVEIEDAIETATTTLRAEQQRVETALAEALQQLWKAKEEQRRSEEALRAALSLLEECQGALGYMEDRGYSSIRHLRSRVHTALKAALPSPDAPTREGER